MEQFIVSARKYRPNSFDSLIGQDNIATTLKNSIIRGQLAHAYLFCGPRGVGKTSAARIFAKSINCLNPSEDMEPCGVCESCLSFNEGRSFCIHELDAASNNSVDDIRNLTELVRIPPQIGKYSVYIIDEVHMLSSAAFNAFLKTLEEPPAYAIFILATTEKHKILPTILSRCQTYDFNRITIGGIIQNLTKIASEEGIKIQDDALHIIAQKADGAMRDALTLFDQTVAFCGKEITYEEVIKNLNVLDYEYYFRLCDAFLEHDHIKALLIFDEVLSKGFNALHFISGLSSHLRDLVVCKNQASKMLMSLPPSLVSRYEELSQKTSVSFLFKSLEISTACEASYRQSGNQRLLIEFALMKMALASQAITPKSSKESHIDPSMTTETPQSEIIPSKSPNSIKDVVSNNKFTSDEKSISNEKLVSDEKYISKNDIESITEKSIAPAQNSVKTGGLSLKAMMENAAKSLDKTQEEVVVELEEAFDLEKATAAWKEMAAETAIKRKSLAMAMTKYALGLDGNTIIFKVSNSSQKVWIENKCLLDMVKTLRSKLKNKNADLRIEVSESIKTDKENKLYMPSQKAKHLESKSEDLREFVKALDLDTK